MFSKQSVEMDAIEEKSYNFALITLKERCHFLKEQLKTVDEENIKLKVQLANNSFRSSKSAVSDPSIERVELLNKQKSQLSNQVHILATENSNMWLRLSKLSIINKTLHRKLSKLSEVLLKNGLQVEFPDQDDISPTMESGECRKYIEDLSLKLISDIKLEKIELDQQYSQMVAVHKTDMCGPSVEIGSLEGEDDNALTRLRRHTMHMNLIKQKLIQQQHAVMSVINEVKRQKESQGTPHSSETHVVDAATATDSIVGLPSVHVAPKTTVEVNANEINVDNIEHEQICPLCGNHIAGSKEIFIDHVSNHITDETNFI